MNIIKKFHFCNLIFAIVFIIFSIVVFGGQVFAASGIKISNPADNTVVNPGQTITITAEAVNGFAVKEGSFEVFKINVGRQEFTSLPASFTITIPDDAWGAIPILVIAKDVSGNVALDNLDLKVQSGAYLVSFDFGEHNYHTFITDWNGKPASDDKAWISLVGVYSDGVSREIPRGELTFTSSDPSIASVDSKGYIYPHKLGKTTITVVDGGATGTVSVEVKLPRGIKPSETISPVTTIEVNPQPNAAGWWNGDITIMLSARDNEGGSGMDEIIYSLQNDGKEQYVNGGNAIITISQEGKDTLKYEAADKERNHEQLHTFDFRLDKTSPQTTVHINPTPNEQGIIETVPVEVTFTATDSLSGVAFTTPNVTLTKNGEYSLKYYSTDVAGNVESPKTVTIKIAVKDTTPPQITLHLQRLGWWSWFNFYRLIFHRQIQTNQ